MKIYSCNLICKIIEKWLKLNIDMIQLGDTIHIKVKFQEIDNQRTQFYVGILWAKNGTGRNSIRIIRNEFNGEIKIERIFYVYVPSIKYSVI